MPQLDSLRVLFQELRAEDCSWHDVIIWLADCCLFVPHLQVDVGAIPYLRVVARKQPTPVLSLLSLTRAGLGSIITHGFNADVFDVIAK